jgi:hypothetical protein
MMLTQKFNVNSQLLYDSKIEQNIYSDIKSNTDDINMHNV